MIFKVIAYDREQDLWLERQFGGVETAEEAMFFAAEDLEHDGFNLEDVAIIGALSGTFHWADPAEHCARYADSFAEEIAKKNETK
jgi:hypothetical protein